jgi:hypothetical protein
VELISRYPELYSKEIEVFDDAGRHIKVDEFEL